MGDHYDIYVDGTFAGTLSKYFPQGLICGHPDAVYKTSYSGSRTVRAVARTGSEVREGTVFLDPQECKVVILQNLKVISNGGGGGGGPAGYNCISGNCVSATSNAQYSTYSACQSNCGGGGGGGGGSSTGDITFWLNQDLGCGKIYVSLASYGSRTITSYYGGNPGCGASGCANFSNLGYGAYYYTATSDGSCTWSGNIQLSASCYTMQLTM